MKFRAAACLLLIVVGAGLPALGPDDAFWDSTVDWIAAEPRLPEDAKMGVLADLRRPDGEWAAAITVCEEAFLSIRSGKPPEASILERMRPLIVIEFERALEEGPLDVYARYGRPVRNGNRVSIPVRAAGEGGVSYGDVYLVRTEEGNWFIDQWALDLSGLRQADDTASE